jgi:hypothetical protein
MIEIIRSSVLGCLSYLIIELTTVLQIFSDKSIKISKTSCVIVFFSSLIVLFMNAYDKNKSDTVRKREKFHINLLKNLL